MVKVPGLVGIKHDHHGKHHDYDQTMRRLMIVIAMIVQIIIKSANQTVLMTIMLIINHRDNDADDNHGNVNMAENSPWHSNNNNGS